MSSPNHQSLNRQVAHAQCIWVLRKCFSSRYVVCTCTYFISSESAVISILIYLCLHIQNIYTYIYIVCVYLQLNLPCTHVDFHSISGYLQPLCFSQKPRAPVRGGASYYSKAPSAVPKIKEALNFMRNHSFEVPFIANYRKEYVEPELDVHDLWTIWQSDEKVCPAHTLMVHVYI